MSAVEVTLQRPLSDGPWRVEVRAFCGVKLFEYAGKAQAGACRRGAQDKSSYNSRCPYLARSSCRRAWHDGADAAGRLMARLGALEREAREERRS